MSIIHDALKKIQQGMPSKADEKKEPVSPPAAPNPLANPYADPPAAAQTTVQNQGQATEQKQPIQNKIKTLLALVCAIAITLGASIFLYKQLHSYVPTVKRWAKTTYHQLVHKKNTADSKPAPPPPLPPLAKINVNPTTPPAPAAIPAKPPSMADQPVPAQAPKPNTPETLDVHGVMSNGKSNLVLINDQVYQEGDEVAGVKIVKIDLDYITVIIKGKEEKIRVKN